MAAAVEQPELAAQPKKQQRKGRKIRSVAEGGKIPEEPLAAGHGAGTGCWRFSSFEPAVGRVDRR